MTPVIPTTQHRDPVLGETPHTIDTSTESITRDVHAANSNCPDDRLKFLTKSLVNHLHAFVRETSLTTDEWMTAIQFLTETGKASTSIRQEFILLSDVLGVSAIVDDVTNVKPPGATESTVLGPFYTNDAHDIQSGGSIASEGKGDYLFVEGRVLDLEGNPIRDAIIDTWETDGFGLYDTQYDDRTEPDCRGRLHSAEDGFYAFRAVAPISYPIPHDGPVGKLIERLGRHPYRPSHLHFRIEAPGYETLITTLYNRGDPNINNDAVFGVRESLIVDYEAVTDAALTLSRGFEEPRPHFYVKRDFVLATPEQCRRAKKQMVA